MEKRDTLSEATGDDHDTGTWIIALTGTGEGFFGRIQRLSNGDPFVGDDATGNEFAVRDVIRAKVVILCPVYDYRERVKEIPVINPENGRPIADPNVPGMPMLQPMRTPLMMPVGFTVEQAPVHVPGVCYGTTLRFLSQMDRRDAETYRNFAKDTREAMKAVRLQASNLKAPTPDEVARLARR